MPSLEVKSASWDLLHLSWQNWHESWPNNVSFVQLTWLSTGFIQETV